MIRPGHATDPWQDFPDDPARPAGMTALQPLGPVAPLDEQIGTLPRKTVPDALRDVLWPPIKNDENTAVYAVIDAARASNLADLLERSGLAHRCLFKGQAEADWGHVAPWIVRLQPENEFTRFLFTRGRFAWHLWDLECGIFLRSDRTLDRLWQHCRKFTKIRDASGKWYFFRFWDPGTLLALARSGNSDLIRGLLRSDCLAEAVLIQDAEAYRLAATDPAPSMAGPRLSEAEWQVLADHARRHFLRQLRGECLEGGASRAHVETVIDDLLRHGFRSRAALRTMALWLSGPAGASVLTADWARAELQASAGLADAIRADRLRNLAEDMAENIVGVRDVG